MTFRGWIGARVAGVAMAALSLPGVAAASGLRCSIGEVVVENLKVGQTYSLKTLANLSLAVTYTGEKPVRASVDPLVPGLSELWQGAEALPDIGWVSATPDSLLLIPGETQDVGLTLAIPDDPALMGRRFEVIFWTHTLPQPGELVAYGLKSRLIFTIDRERETPGASPTGDLSITLQPAHITLENISAGRRYRLEKVTGSPLTIRNTSDHEVRVALKAIHPTAGAVRDDGSTDLLGRGAVTLNPEFLTLGPGEEHVISGTLSIAGPKGRGEKSMMCLISASVVGQPVRTEIQSQLFVHVR